MARSIQVIYQAMVSDAATKPQLAAFQSTSATAIKNLIFYVCATGINLLEQLLDSQLLDYQTIQLNTPINSAAWWVNKFKTFAQFNIDPAKGVLMISNTFVPFYQVTDVASQIYKFVACLQDNDRNVTIKLAKDDGSGNPTQLSLDELNSAKGFVARMQIVGLLINTVSFPADFLKINVDIYFDSQYLQSDVKNNVQNAIITYLQSLQFGVDGSVLNSKLFDAIQTVQGVSDVYINDTQARNVNNGYTPYTRIYNTVAGYIQLDTTNSVINLIGQ